jgi:intraflagellar transport protein 140
LDLSFRAKQFGALQMISGDLDERADPELLQRCADFFLENEQFDKAVDLLSIGKNVWPVFMYLLTIIIIQYEKFAFSATQSLQPL